MIPTPISSLPICSRLSKGKIAFLTGTLLLTSTGFLCRILGFFYRIYMSRTIGAEGLGLYNMVHPIFSICFAICAGSIQTALSQYVASHQEQGNSIFRTGLAIFLPVSLLLAWAISQSSGFLAEHFLMEPRCAPYLPVIALSVPFAALHSCINGYYYGMQNARIPAFSQVAEQMIRMGSVFLIAHIWTETGRPITVSLAVFGHLIGEMASAAYTLFCLGFFPPLYREKQALNKKITPKPSHPFLRFKGSYTFFAPLMTLSLPLMANRLVLNLLATAEAVWIPNRLTAYGLTNSQALSVYGVLTSMALPFILFPSAITNSIAVLLLPTVAKAQADGNHRRISSMISMSLRYSCYMGILCIGIFTLFGKELGNSVFHDPRAGLYITVLSWLCPFLYLSTTMGSILNGLGKTSVTFFQNVSAMLIRLGFVLFAVPDWGIRGVLWGMLASELILALISFHSVKKWVPFSWNTGSMILKPTAILLLTTGIHLTFSHLFPLSFISSFFLETAIRILFFCLFYCGFLLLFHRPMADKTMAGPQ